MLRTGSFVGITFLPCNRYTRQTKRQSTWVTANLDVPRGRNIWVLFRRALIALCTTTIRGLASEVRPEPGDDPIPLRSAVIVDWVESVSLGTLTERLGRLGDRRMREICAALAVAVDSGL